MVLSLPPRAFAKADTAPDSVFYEQPRFVAHIDGGAIAAVTALYREFLPSGMILDLQSSWISHLPPECAYDRVTGHGMNAEELAANPRLDDWFVRDLNADPTLPLPDRGYTAACDCVSVQYLQHPAAVFAEVRRVLAPGSPFVASFSNRCFPTKAVAIWYAVGDHPALVTRYCEAAGFADIRVRAYTPTHADPLWAVIGRA